MASELMLVLASEVLRYACEYFAKKRQTFKLLKKGIMTTRSRQNQDFWSSCMPIQNSKNAENLLSFHVT